MMFNLLGLTCIFISGRLLYVKGLTPQIHIADQNKSINNGDVARFDCSVKYRGPYEVSWLKIGDLENKQTDPDHLTTGGSRITHDTRMTIIRNTEEQYMLEIRDVKLSDSGIYQCQISTNPIITANAYLSVLYRPKINPNLPDINAQIGQDITLQCSATGYPKPTIYWQRENQKLISSIVGPKYYGNTLVIKNASRNDRGTYICAASSSIGTDYFKYNVNLEFPPIIRIDASKKSVGGMIGKRVELVCSIESNPRSNMYWKFNDLELTDDENVKIVRLTERNDQTSMQLTLNALRKMDLGNYQCIATNIYGGDSETITLFEINGSLNRAHNTVLLWVSLPLILFHTFWFYE